MTAANEPLISCIMPTCDRPEFVPKAIRYFLNQDYSNKELLIVDDGAEAVSGLIPENEQIRYIRVDQKLKLGTKRNLCIEESRSDLIMHWDDDDWFAPNRISYQVKALLDAKAGVCGLRRMLFFHLGTKKAWLYQYPDSGRNWLAGGSLLYTKDFWKRSPFPDIQRASDTKFIWSSKMDAYVVLDDYRFYVAMIHPGNTSPKNTANNLWSLYPVREIKSLMQEDWKLYEGYRKIARSRTEVNEYQKRRAKEFPHRKTTEMVSACLLSWKRPENLKRIVNSIRKLEFIDEILVWNNNPEVTLSFPYEKVRIIQSKENLMCYGRFLCAKEAKNEIVYVQDDDFLVKNIPDLYRHFLKDQSRITHAIGQKHLRRHDKDNYESGQVAMLGWGAFISKSWTSMLDEHLKLNQPDKIFKREADIIFSLLQGKQHHPVPANVTELPDNSASGIALYRQRHHELYRALAIRSALNTLRQIKFPTDPVTWNIVITCRNYGHFLEEAVRSVLMNKADYMITIVDDASSDDTGLVVRNLTEKYPFVHYIRYHTNIGVSAARNAGIASLDSRFVVLLDADDMIGTDYLYEAEKLLRKGHDVINPDAVLFGNIRAARWVVPENVSLQMLLKKNCVHCAAAFRRELWDKAGGIDESMDNWQDYDFWIRLARAGAKIRKINGDHFFYRKHGYTKSSESAEKRDQLISHIREKHKPLYMKYQLGR